MRPIQPSKFTRFNRTLVKLKIMALQLEEFAENKEEVQHVTALSNVAREVQEILMDAPVAEKSNRGRKAATPAETPKRKK